MADIRIAPVALPTAIRPPAVTTAVQGTEGFGDTLKSAVSALRRAVTLAPASGPAHYNLALAYERQNERRKALRHWVAYLKLDPIGPWANHARGQTRKILDREKLTIVYRSPRTIRLKSR